MDEDQSLRELAEKRVGTVLGGKYTVNRILGVGGMAVVYAATHRNQKQVAIKMLHPQVSHHPELRKRFLREGYVANSVKHRGAVDVIDDEVLEDGSAFIVMEYLEGAPVDVLAERNQERLPLPAALAIAHELCNVLEAAHRRDIVHRDVKPANVFLTHEGELKVLDFGIARLKEPGSVHATNTGVMLGTPAFMSPEQARGETNAIGPATDIWAVGAMLFKLLSGTYVHEADNAQMLLIAVATKPPRSLAAVAPEMPRDVVDIVDRALQFAPSSRWSSAALMKTAIMQVYLRLSALPIPQTLAALHNTEREPSGVSNLASTMPQTPNYQGGAPVVVMPQAMAMTPPPRTVPTPPGLQPRPSTPEAPRPAIEATDGPVSRSSFVTPVASKGGIAAIVIGALFVVGGISIFFTLRNRESGITPASSGIVQASEPPKATPENSATATVATTTTTTTASVATTTTPSASAPTARPNPNVGVATKKTASAPPPSAPVVATPPPPPSSTRPDPGSVR